MHGYEMIQEIAERSGGAWKPSPGSVYPTLQLLGGEGLIVSESEGGKKLFSLTEAGRTAAEDGPEAPWEGAPRAPPPRAPHAIAGNCASDPRLPAREKQGRGERREEPTTTRTRVSGARGTARSAVCRAAPGSGPHPAADRTPPAAAAEIRLHLRRGKG